MPVEVSTEQDVALAEEIASYYDDMLGAVLFLYPWGEPGTVLEHSTGPSREQARFLDDLSDEIKARAFDGIHAVPSIQMAISSGHGTGKTELIGMLSGALMSTRDGLRGTVTANSGQQLTDKTWAAIQKYKKLLVCSHWFGISTEKFWRIGRKEDWFMAAVTWKEENADAFQGQHAKASSSVYIFDEDSNIPQAIHTAAEGGTIHGEAMQFRFGNCTRRQGPFYETCFGVKRGAWLKHTLGPTRGKDHAAGIRRWNAEETELRNEEQNKEWAEEYGTDSDFYRVRVQGLPPNASDLQFIPSDLITLAQRAISRPLPDDPLVAGVDLAWGGSDPICIRFARGTDWRSIPPIKIQGDKTKDEALVVTKLIDVLTRDWNGRKVSLMTMDSAGSCGNLCRRLRELGHHNILEVNFGGHSPDSKYKLMRSYMWGLVRDGLQRGCAIDTSPDLEADLSAVGHTITRHTEILLEEKQKVIKRLGHSTDDGDALALAAYASKLVPSQQKKDAQREAYERRRASGRVGAWS